MNVALSGQEIDDTEAQYLQDILLDKPGLARRRGPIQEDASFTAKVPWEASGFAVTSDPDGITRYGVLQGTTTAGYFSTWNGDKTALVDHTWPHVLPALPAYSAVTDYRYVDIKPALTGGSWIGVADEPGADQSLHGLALWGGGTSAEYSTGTITFTRGSATVTGSGTAWLANASAGMFLFANTDDASAGTFTDTLIGQVRSVNSDTSLTLDTLSPYSGSAGRSYTLRAIRGFIPRVVKGIITCATDSTTVSGGATKFSTQGLGSGTWNLYRASDFTWIGKVASVASDLSLTLAANAAIALADERYIAIRGDWSTNDKSIDIQTSHDIKTGWLNSIYAERQWYANNGANFEKTYRIWFSDTLDKEGVDTSEDGDWIPVSAQSDIPEPIRALVPTYNALIVLKDSEAFAVYGTSPSSFSAKKLEDDGTISTMSVQPYGGGAIWAGRYGIYFYNGVEVRNLMTPKFGDAWKNSVRSMDTNRYRMYSMVVRNHYILHIEDLDPTIGVVKGNTQSSPTHWVVAVNMVTQAVTLWTNVKLRGAAQLPAQDGRDVKYVVNGQRSTESLGQNVTANVTGLTSLGVATVSISADTVDKVWGTASAAIVVDGAGTGQGYEDISATGRVAAVLGNSIKGSLWIKSPSGVNVNFTITERDSSHVAGTAHSVAHTGTGTWTLVTNSFTCADADCAEVTWGVGTTTTVAGTIRLNGVVVEQAANWTDISHAHVCTAEALFDAEGLDEVIADWGTRGPDFYMVTKKYNAGNDVQLKRFKQFAIHYLAQGGAINIDTVLGLNEIGTTLATQLPESVLTWDQLSATLPNWSSVAAQYPAWDGLISGVFRPKRARFLKKDHHLSFRLWQDSATMTRVKVGPFHIAYKLMRPTRVT